MPDIHIKQINILRGPNIWAHQPVIEAHLDIGPYEERPSNEIPGFTERLFEALPSLITHRCSEGRWGGFLMRMRDGTYMGHIIEHVSLELQCLAGMDVAYGKTRSEGRDFPGEYRLVIEYREGRAGKLSIEVAAEGCESLACGEPYDFTPAIRELAEIGQYRMLTPAMRNIRDAARHRGIPWLRIKGKDNLQLGYGKCAAIISDDHYSLSNKQYAIQQAQPEEYYDAIIDSLLPNGDDGRIPIIAIAGSRGKTTVARMIGQILKAAGYYAGTATSEGSYLDGVLASEGNSLELDSADQAEIVLTNPQVEAAVLETSHNSILHFGLAFDVCDVGVVLNVTDDGIGQGGIYDLEDCAMVKGVVIESVRRNGYGILNADDPLVADLARDCDGEIVYFSPDPKNPLLKKHLKKGGHVATVIDGTLTLQKGKTQTSLIKVEDLPAKQPHQIENAMAAAAATWAAGVSPDVISKAWLLLTGHESSGLIMP